MPEETAVLEQKPDATTEVAPPPKPAVVLKGGISGVLKEANDKLNFGKGVVAKKEPDKSPEKIEEKKPETDKPAEGEKAAEKKADEPKPDEQKASESEKKTPEQSFAELRVAKEKVEADHKAAAARIAELEQQVAKKGDVPEDVQKRIDEQEKVIDAMRTQLRAAAIERDPAFQEKYVQGRQKKVNQMADIAREIGIEEAAVVSAFRGWKEDTFGEWMENMSPGQKAKFQGAWQGFLELNQQQQAEVADADKTYEQRIAEQKKQIEAQQRAGREQAAADTKAIVEEFRKMEGYGQDAELLADIENTVKQAAGIAEGDEKWDGLRWLRTVAYNRAMAKVVTKNAALIEQMAGRITELETSLAEKETFIKEQAGGIPRGGAGAEIKGTENYRSISDRIRVTV